MHVATGQKQGRGSAVVGEANSSEEIQALSKEVLDLFNLIYLLFLKQQQVKTPLHLVSLINADRYHAL